MDEKQYKIGPRTLAVLEAAGDDDTRPVLMGLHIKGHIAEATNGRIMMQTEAEIEAKDALPEEFHGGKPEEIIIPAEVVTKAERARPKQKNKSLLPILNYMYLIGERELAATDLDKTVRTTFKQIEGAYPNTKSVEPTGEVVFEIALSPALLETLCKAAKKADSGCIKFEFYGKNDAVAFSMRSGDDGLEVRGIVMPMHLD